MHGLQSTRGRFGCANGDPPSTVLLLISQRPVSQPLLRHIRPGLRVLLGMMCLCLHIAVKKIAHGRLSFCASFESGSHCTRQSGPASWTRGSQGTEGQSPVCATGFRSLVQRGRYPSHEYMDQGIVCSDVPDIVFSAALLFFPRLS